MARNRHSTHIFDCSSLGFGRWQLSWTIWPRQESSLIMKSYNTGKINWIVKASHQNTATRCHHWWASISDISSLCMHSYFPTCLLFFPPEFFCLSFFSSYLLFYSILRTHIQIVLAVGGTIWETTLANDWFERISRRSGLIRGLLQWIWHIQNWNGRLYMHQQRELKAENMCVSK